MLDKFSLHGKTALVTGGSGGIGFGIAEGLAGAGADLVIVARSRERLESARAKLAGTGRKIHIYEFDMSDIEGIRPLYDKIAAKTGGVDVLANVAGMSSVRVPAEQVEDADWQAVIDLNLTSVFRLSQAFAKERIASGKKGKIINIASLQSERARNLNTAYAAAKGGIRMLTMQLAVDWAKYGVLVNAIGPGYYKTELTRALWESEEFDKWVHEKTPLGRWGEPSDLAGAAVFLASEASDFITGQTIYVDGGWLALM